MRILFIGTVEFSKSALEKLIELKTAIVGVITKESSDFNTDFTDLGPICRNENIPFIYTKDVNSIEIIEWIKGKKPDVIFCFGWSSLFKNKILNITRLGVVGFHPAMLPLNRGRHPLIWTLVLGLEKTASTFFFMDSGADSGDILRQKEIIISYDDNANTLYKKVSAVALTQIKEFLPKLRDNTYVRVKQNHKLANYWRKRTKEDGKIDFRMSSRAIYNLVRALTRPYAGAHLIYNNYEIKVWTVKEVVYTVSNLEYGKVIDISGSDILVKCYDNAVLITEHEFIEIPKIGDYLL